VDISHLSAPGVAHLAEIAAAPYIASHSSCRALCDHPRNLTDDQIAAVAGSGGFVAMNAFGPFISTVDPSIDRFVDHVEHAISIAGGDRVAIGADFIDDLVAQVDPILGRQLLVRREDLSMIPDLKAPSHFPALTDALIARLGEVQADAVASGNMIRFFRANLPEDP
jgi:membrane dipeptidase